MQIQTILTSMLTIREAQGRPPYGLCYEFECTSEFLFNINYDSGYAWTDFIQDQFPQWYSGNQAFPIASSEYVCPGDAYHHERYTQEPTEYSTRRLTILQRACELAHLFELIETTPNKITLSYVGYQSMSSIRDLFTQMIDNQSRYAGIGLCAQVRYQNSLIQQANEAIAEFIKDQLPEYWSGHPTYPIAHPTIADPQLAYYECADNWKQQQHEEYLSRRSTILAKACSLSHLFTIIPNKDNPTKCVLIYNE